tara:strand:+ start:1797 stop:2564 length:768 start_codon:yes stop_codon:yes gene_type:complete
MKKVKILVGREPLSKGYVQSKQNFEHVLSQVKHLKPPIWKTPWFYGPVGLAVVALSVTAINSLPPDKSRKSLRLEAVLPIKQRKIEAEALAFISPKDVKTNSFREIIPKKIDSEKIIPKIDDEKVYLIEEIKEPTISFSEKIIENQEERTFSRPLTKLPSINRVYTGEISALELCSNGIECLDSKITSFSLQYYNGRDNVVENLQGNAINDNICEALLKFNINEMIFITKIRALNSLGQKISHPSMNLIPIEIKN